jgi:uncharacterized membrane protein YqjE
MTESPNRESQTDAGGGEAATSGMISGLFRSLTNLAATLVAIAQTRLELLTTELQEEVHYTVGILVWAFIALLTAMIALFFGGLTIVLVYWETHPVIAALTVTAVFLALAIVAILILASRIKGRPRFLDATLTELSKDARSLKSQL